jgi:hypothetical protein
MIIDCEACGVRGNACGECVIGVLLGAPACPGGAPDPTAPPGAPIVQLDAPERRALDVLADQGLVPRLRLVAVPPRRATRGAAAERSVRDTG